MPDDTTRLENHRVVSHNDWLTERKALLEVRKRRGCAMS